MGRSIELLGLAAFNVFLVVGLSVTVLSRAGPGPVDRLTESNVTQFVNETTDISSGKRANMDKFGMTSFFMAHIADDGKFTNTISYEMPEVPVQQRVLEMGKTDFISRILQDLHTIERRETAVHVEHVGLNGDKTSAAVLTTTLERGLMSVSDEESGQSNLVPVSGRSYCEQTIVLNKHVIQMAGATCTTTISFMPNL